MVIPAVGPLVPGHVMVVSKAHHSSLASMGRSAIAEYDRLAARLRRLSVWGSGLPLESEHGSTEADKAGSCVVHCHIHWLPGMGQHLEFLSSRLTRIRKTGTLYQLTANQPYIFLRAGTTHQIFGAKFVPSQVVRRLLCEVLNRDDTDWRSHHRLDVVSDTVETWTRVPDQR